MSPSRRTPMVLLALALLVMMLPAAPPSTAVAQTAAPTKAADRRVGSLPLDEESTAAIRDATTEEEFLTPWVEVLPDHPTVPSPRDFLGYAVGTPGQLTSVDQIHGYLRALEGSSPRVRVFGMGRSHEGRETILVAIADEGTMEELDVYRGHLRRLADPRVTSEAEAEQIVRGAKPVYWMTAGLHSPELGPPEMVMELAYRLAVEDREPFQVIRDRVITLITPVLEADGRARQVDWYFRHVKGHTDYKDMPRRSAPFWGHYVFHDNNRDAIAVTQPLTRNYFGVFFDWLPTISLDLHESVPLLYVSTGTGPYNERVDPLTVSEWHALATYEVTRLTALGLPGVWTWGFYTGWYPGYLLWVTNTHNAMGRFYETFGNGSADTMERDLRHARYAGKKITERQWYRSIPPEEKVTWSMRDNTNYMQSGVLASLEMVARNGQMFLSNFYRKGANAVRKGRDEAPHAFVIRREQRDSAAASTLVEILHRQGIEVSRIERTRKLGEKDAVIELNEGDVLVRLDQPYGPLARNLLEKQDFPSDVEVPPYDDVAWTLGLHLGVDVEPIDEPAVLELDLPKLEPGDVPPFEIDLPDRAGVWVIPHEGQREIGPLRFALADVPMQSAAESFEHEKETFAPGALLVRGDDVDTPRLRDALTAHGLEAVALKSMPEITTHDLDVPRIALLQSWTSTQNAGWARYTLDEAGIPYVLVSKDRLRAGSLRQEFDVILVPSFWGGARARNVIAGLDPKWGPMPYTNTPETPSHGVIDRSEDITGGFGFVGMEELRRFVEAGGTLIALGSAGVLATETGMLGDVEVSRPGGLRTPGSFLTTKLLQPGSPLVYGYEEITHVFRGNGPLYALDEYDRYLAVMQFGTKAVGDEKEDDAMGSGEPKGDRSSGRDQDHDTGPDEEGAPLVLSGGVVQGDAIDGEPALLSVALGEGRVVLFAWNPMHRHLNHHDHAFVYNAILHWNDLPVPERKLPEATAED